MDNLIAVAFIGGLVSVLSPCVLPILPVIMAGSVGHRLRPIAIVLGMAVTFSLTGIVTSTVGGTLAGYARYIRVFATLVIILMGLILVSRKLAEKFVLFVSVVMQKFHPEKVQDTGTGLMGGFILGLSLGLVWVPCVGPIVGSILVLVALEGDVILGGLALFSFAVGIGIPMILVAYAGKRASKRITGLARYAGNLKKIAGIVLILTGIFMLLGLDTDVQFWLYPYFPEIEEVVKLT
jgi:cytochrome c-type biogenesis protein